MDDLRSEIRAAFEKEQALNPPVADLRSRIRHRVATQPRRETGVQWLAVAAAVVIGILVVVGLMSTRQAHRSSVPAAHPTPSPIGDYGPPPAGVPLFYLEDPSHPGWYVGFDWNGVPRGTIKLATPLDPGIVLQQSPDGSSFDLSPGGKGGGTTFLNRLGTGQTAGTPGMWADDSLHTCAVSFDQQKYTWTLITGGPGQTSYGRPVTVIATDSAIGQTGVSLAACSFKNDRAIAVRTSVSWPSEVWVIRLSDGQVLSHRGYADAALGNIVASPDAALIAENSRYSVDGTTPDITVIRSAADGHVVATLDPSVGVIGFSSDDKLALVTTSPLLPRRLLGLAAIDIALNKVVWRYEGTSALAGFLTQPLGAGFAVMLQSPSEQGPHPHVSVVMVFADGRSLGVPGEFVRP